jgi:hypothetical protein
MLQSDAVIWFQRYQRSDLKRGSISLDSLDVKCSSCPVFCVNYLHIYLGSLSSYANVKLSNGDVYVNLAIVYGTNSEISQVVFLYIQIEFQIMST